MNDRQRKALQKKAKIQLARQNFADFVDYTFPRFAWNWHHKRLCWELDQAAKFKKTHRRVIIVTPPRHGKALHVDTPILTPDRGFVRIADLVPGDFVFGSDGKPTRVVAVSEVWKNRPCYAVSVNGGQDTIIADENHEWVVETCRKAKTRRVRETKTLSGYSRAWKVDRSPALQFGRDAEVLPVPPYLLGLWLGDGCSHHATITGKGEDLELVRRFVEESGVLTSDRADDCSFGLLGVWTSLKELGLAPAKFIPSIYLRASFQDREELLQGLIDSDGHVAPDGQVEFCSIKEDLAKQVLLLVRSLGVRAQLVEGDATLNGAYISKKYRVLFYRANSAKIPRKATRCRDATKSTDFFIRVNPTAPAGTICIQVEAEDHLFLAGKSLIPTHNSELVSRRLPAYMMGCYPQMETIQWCYSGDLASKMGRDARKIMESPEFKDVFPDFQPGDKWTEAEMSTIEGGSYKTAGVDGGVTGRGANLVIVDDPFKNREEAESSTRRERVWESFQDDLVTRVEYPYSIVVTMTRWHPDDLVGRLLKREPGRWRIVHMPLIADHEEWDEEKPEWDPRKPGEPLWPGVRLKGRIDSPDIEVPSDEELAAEIIRDAETKKSSNPQGFYSLDQGRPRSKEGKLFRKDWFQRYQSPPDLMEAHCRSVVLSIDANFKKTSTSSAAALVVLGLRNDGKIVILDAYWQRLSWVELKKKAREMADKWPRATAVIEAKANGEALIDELKQDGITVVPWHPGNESKESRAHKCADVAESGGLFFPEHASWVENLITLFTDFPDGEFDDPVDAVTQAVLRWGLRSDPLSHLRRICGERAER